MTEYQKKQLEQQLWNVANQLRGKMHADEFRDYCLGFIFFKYLSEKMHHHANGILDDGRDYLEIDEQTTEGLEELNAIREDSVEQLGFFIKPNHLFASLATRGENPDEFILDDLSAVLKSIERSTMGTESEDDFEHLFEDLDLTSTKLGRTEAAKNSLIAKILTHLNKVDFLLDQVDSDVLGDAYEYLIGQFASGAGKKAGEFYTPAAVSTILAKIVTTGKDRLKSVYDPTCGSGSLLLRVAREVESVGDYYGQEMNRTTYNLCRMNMIMHEVHFRNFDIKQEDTLERPQHLDKRFEAVVANPPFSAKWSANPLHLSDDRFSQYGKLAPASKADFAFVQHMLYHLDDSGTMAVILPHGVLFRGAAEGHIRKYLIQERNWLDAVIGLPANIFYGTDIPTCILVFKKCRENPKDILFIDASSHFENATNQNVLLPEQINKIVYTYRKRLEEPKYSCRALLTEIDANDYDLKISIYVDTFIEEELIDLGETVKKLSLAQNVSNDADLRITSLCSELKIPFPNGHNHELLRRYKRGVMQKLFTRELRFKDDKGFDFPKWEEQRFEDVFDRVTHKNTINNTNVLTISAQQGLINQQEYFNKSVAAKDLSGYYLLRRGEFAYNKSYSKGYPMGAIKRLHQYEFGVVSTLYICFKTDNEIAACFYEQYFESGFLNRELHKIAQEGARNHGLLNLSVVEFFKNIVIPKIHPNEQQKIADFLSAIDIKIEAVTGQIDKMKSFKNGFLQQMFV